MTGQFDGLKLQEFLEVNGEEILEGDDANELWLILQQLDHPLYKNFLRDQVAFEQLRFPDNALIVNPLGAACFKTISQALEFANKAAKFSDIRLQLGSEESRTQGSVNT